MREYQPLMIGVEHSKEYLDDVIAFLDPLVKEGTSVLIERYDNDKKMEHPFWGGLINYLQLREALILYEENEHLSKNAVDRFEAWLREQSFDNPSAAALITPQGKIEDLITLQKELEELGRELEILRIQRKTYCQFVREERNPSILHQIMRDKPEIIVLGSEGHAEPICSSLQTEYNIFPHYHIIPPKDTYNELKAELSRKLIGLEELPTQEECVTLLEILESEQRLGWLDFCKVHGIYQVVHEELVDKILEILSGLNPSCIVEIGSSNGKLAYWLNQRGFDVTATDNNGLGITQANFVERLDHKEALQKYNPDMVLLCWAPEDSSIPIDVLDYPSVRYLVHFGNAGRLEWGEEIEKRPNIRVQDLDEPPYSYTYPTFDDDRGADRSINLLYEVVR